MMIMKNSKRYATIKSCGSINKTKGLSFFMKCKKFII